MLCVCTFWSNHTQQFCWSRAEPRAMMEGNYKWGALNLTDWLLLLLLLLMMKMSFDGGVRVGISHVRVRSGPGWLAGAVSKCDLMYGFCPTRSSNSLAWGAPSPAGGGVERDTQIMQLTFRSRFKIGRCVSLCLRENTTAWKISEDLLLTVNLFFGGN